jgi:hypothetical protein
VLSQESRVREKQTVARESNTECRAPADQSAFVAAAGLGNGLPVCPGVDAEGDLAF